MAALNNAEFEVLPYSFMQCCTMAATNIVDCLVLFSTYITSLLFQTVHNVAFFSQDIIFQWYSILKVFGLS
jgi:hypothetical protein